MSQDLIVEGLEPEDFIVLEHALKVCRLSIDDNITMEQLIDVYNKIKKIVDYINDK